MRPPSTEIVPIYLQVDPVDIGRIKFLFESHEDVAIIRTLDREQAVIVLLVVPDFLAVARAVIDELSRDLPIQELDEPAVAHDDWLLSAL